jgi:hypothetical protein
MAHIVAFRKTSKPNVFNASRLSNHTEMEGTVYKSMNAPSEINQEKRESQRSLGQIHDYVNGSAWSRSHSNLFGSKPASVSNQLLK